MGNETSILSEYKIDETPIFSNDDFALHCAHRKQEQLNVFISTSADSHKRLESLAQNLKRYRHPGILRYVHLSSPNKSCQYLFTERASPLSVILKENVHSSVISLGLYDIVQSLDFLHNRAKTVHNNIRVESVFVTPNGRWKLSGLQLLQSLDKVTKSNQESTRPPFQVGKSLEETTKEYYNHPVRDIYFLGVMIQEIMTITQIENSSEIREFVQSRMCRLDYDSRSTLHELLRLNFFHENDLIKIVEFLKTLPFQQEQEAFFEGLTERLFRLPETVIAIQLTSLLLSRVVLLNSNAVKLFLPNFLTPYSVDSPRPSFCRNNATNPIMSEILFRKYLIPHLQKIFHVREYEIRSFLLKQFSTYCRFFSRDVLEDEILPELLLGIRDRSDEIVSLTLRALADLVHILGALQVVGTDRQKIFADGKPSIILSDNALLPPYEERTSPIGAENDGTNLASDNENDYDDWRWHDEKSVMEERIESTNTESTKKEKTSKSRNITDDLSVLDIKCSKSSNDIDFFADMRPAIQKTVYQPVIEEVDNVGKRNSKFDMNDDIVDTSTIGWGDFDDDIDPW